MSKHSDALETKKQQLLQEYFDYLVARNGITFQKREAAMSGFEKPSTKSEMIIDAERFNRNYGQFDDANISNEEMALLAFVKINAGEAYGVETVSHARANTQTEPNLVSRIESMVTQEEQFHTRILVSAAQHFAGLKLNGAWKPDWALKTLISSLVHVPNALFYAVLLASEQSGVFIFQWLLHRLNSLFAKEPLVREAFEQRLIEILIDEVGHVAFNQIMTPHFMQPAARRLSHSIAATQSSHELRALGFESSVLAQMRSFDFSQLPQQVRRQSFYEARACL